MWLMTGFGILMPAVRPAKTIARGDDRTMQIRARVARHLDILRARYMPGTLGPTQYTASMDYEYRAYCTPHAFALAVATMITEIDYLKFKPITEDRYGDRDLHDTYNSIWSVVSSRLSTHYHRTAYWHGQRPANGKAAGTAYYGGASYDSTAVPKSWPAAALPAGAPARRDTGAERDAYEPDPVLAELDEAAAALDDENTRAVDALYDEIDEMLDADLRPMDHSDCAHSSSDNARARCRRRRRRQDAARTQEIRALIAAAEDSGRSASV